jgi:hypothetical protein
MGNDELRLVIVRREIIEKQAAAAAGSLIYNKFGYHISLLR